MYRSINQDALACLTAHLNLPAICRKYDISRENIKKFLGEKLVDVTDLKIPLENIGRNAKNWDVATKGIADALNVIFQEKLNHLLTVIAFNSVNFSNEIAKVIVQQMKREFDNQGFFNHLTQGKFIITVHRN